MPFGQWTRRAGGKEYRGVRTRRYTYVRDLKGPWLLYDNEVVPYQLKNVCNNHAYRAIQARLEHMLQTKLKETRDEFLDGENYLRTWGGATRWMLPGKCPTGRDDGDHFMVGSNTRSRWDA